MTPKSLEGRSVLVTGAAGGMGREYVLQLLALGARVLITDRDGEGLRQTAALAGSAGVRGRVLCAIRSDLSTREGCEALHRAAEKITPSLDILISNAGLIQYGYFWEIPPEQCERLLAVNLLAPMRLARLFLPGMVERGAGHLVFMCSVAGFAATALGTPYVTSKFGLRGFAMALSGEVRDKGLDVTIVYPSWVRTDLLRSPEFGSARVGALASFLAEDPARVVREAIRGIRRKKLHVCPGVFAKLVWQAARVWPIVSRQAH